MTDVYWNALPHWADGWASGVLRASWQGGLAILLAWALVRALPRIPPRLRCWLWRLVYVKLLVAFLWATPVDLPLLPAAVVTAATASTSLKAPSLLPTALPQRPLEAAELSGTAGRQRPPVPFATCLLGLWSLGAVWCVSKLVREWMAGQCLGRRCAPVPDGELTSCCQALCRRLGLRRPPLLLLSDGGGSPVLLDPLDPTLVLPSALVAQCAPAELELMLAHELAHLKRRDLWWGWLPALVHGLFYFHPCLWLANRELRLSQELAADECAVRVTHAPVHEYGHMLVKVAAQLRRRPQLGLATVGTHETPQTLRQRLLAMQDLHRFSQRRWLLAGVILVAFGLMLVVPWRVTAQGSQRGKESAAGGRSRPSGARRQPSNPSRTATATEDELLFPNPAYVHFSVTTDGRTVRLSPEQESLETPIDLDLRLVPPGEALRRIFEQAKQAYIVDGKLPDYPRINLRENGWAFSVALGEVVNRQLGGGWIQEIRNGKPIIRITPTPSFIMWRMRADRPDFPQNVAQLKRGGMVTPEEARYLERVAASGTTRVRP
jgi:beta-lactamase regulating signal transducer with metallopeptidase domain